MASELKNCYVIGVDNCFYSLSIAKFNAHKLKINNVFFKYSNWFSHIQNKKFNIIVSNPPYLSYLDFVFSRNDLLFEPYNALVSGPRGIEHIQYIIINSHNFLTDPGWLCIEHCYKQKELVQELFIKNFFTCVNSYKDYTGRFRVTIGLYSKKIF